MKITHTLHILSCLLLLAGTWSACSEENDWEINKDKAALFRVYNIEVAEDKIAAQTASVTWSATSPVEYYLIEVSTEAFTDQQEMGTGTNSIVYGSDKSITSIPVLLTGLTKETTYYLRVKSFGNNLQSQWACLEEPFTTTSEDILQKEMSLEDVSAESVCLHWNDAGLPVTHLKYEWEVTAGEEVHTEEAVYTLSGDEISAQSATISGLLPGKKYVFYLYNEDDLRGTAEATTEQILQLTEVLGGRVTLHWNSNGEAVTRLTYISTGNAQEGTPAEHLLTEEEINSQKVTIDKLSLGESYAFRLYNESTLRGAISTTTEQIIHIAESDIRGRSVTVCWEEQSVAINRLTYQATNGEELLWKGELQPSGTEIKNLEGETQYTFRTYTDDILRGEQTVTTLKALIDVTISAAINEASFTWEPDAAAVSYACTAEGSEPEIKALTSEEQTSGKLTLQNLKGNTRYVFALYNAQGALISNEQYFQTQADPLEGYQKIYLEESPSIDTWNAIWSNPNVSGKVALVLQKNGNYDMSNNSNYTYAIPAAVTALAIWGGEDGTLYAENEKPVIGFRKLTFMGDMEKIDFFNVAIKSNGSNSNYIIRQAHAARIQELNFRSCRIYDAASLFVARDGGSNGGSCQQITIQDCYINNIGNYNVIGVQNNVGFVVHKIHLSNSTINGCTGNIIRLEQNDNSCDITITQSTLYNSPQAMIRSSSNTNPVSISNSLIVSVNTSTNATFNSYDKVFTSSDCYGVTWATKTAYDAAAIFPQAAEGNFTVGVAELKGYGDLRWNK